MRKKFIFIIVSAIFAFGALFSGCSCAGDKTLAFSINSLNSETFTYTVSYEKSYLGTSAEYSDAFFEYGAGEFVTTLKSAESLADKGSEEIKNIIENTAYVFTTDFSIDLTITIGGQPYYHKETVKTTAYFAGAGYSLAPLYATEESEYLNIGIINSETKAYIIKTETVTNYDKNSFTTSKKFASFDLNETATLENQEPVVTTANYAFKTAIDNAELLYALRGVALNESSSTVLPVISSAYKTPTDLKVTNESATTGEFTINDIKETKSYDTLSFVVNNTDASGSKQYVKVQSATANAQNAPLLLEYAKPLIYSDNGNYASMGWLVFTLSEIA